jgi:hypothetical protein
MELSDNIQDLIVAFVRGELSGTALESFQKLLIENPNVEEEVEQLKALTEMLDEDSWSITPFDAQNETAKEYLKFYTDKSNQTYFQLLKSLDAEANQPKQWRKLKWMYSALATAAVLIIGIFLFQPKEKQDSAKMFSANNVEELPSFNVRSATPDSILLQIEKAYNQQQFSKVNDLIEQHLADIPPEFRDLVSIYNGVAYGERALYPKAIEIFSNPDIFDDSIYQPMADWYLALYFLKSEKIIKAKILLMEIAENTNHYKQNEAAKLLKEIK